VLALKLAACLFVAEGVARAATPVIFAQGDPAQVLARLDAKSDGALEPMPLEQLRQTPPRVEGGSVRACTGAPVELAVVLSLVKDAEGDLLYLDYDRALGSLDQASASLVCLTGAADRTVLTRIFFLTGYARFSLGDVVHAKESWIRLFQTEPGYAWDAELPPDGTDVFEATRHQNQATLPVIFTVVPMPPNGTLLADGATPPLSGTLAPGVHLLQMIDAGRTSTLEVTLSGDGPATIVWPGLLPADPLDWMNDARGQDAFGAAIDSTIQAGAVIVTTPTDTWRRTTSGAPFETVDLQAGTRRTRWLVLGGSVLATGGATLVIVKTNQANDAADLAASTHELDTYQDAQASYESAQTQRLVGIAITAGGVALACVGFALPGDSGWSIRTTPTSLSLAGAW
jgi:hypothetical protein